MINLGTIRALFAISVIVFACGSATQHQDIINRLPPKPFEKEFRDRWLNDMHRTAPGLDWRQLEHQNKLEHPRYRDKSLSKRSAEMETLADGRIMATWRERGSTNQAGRVGATLFMEDTEEIYLLAHGGTLWKGPLDGSNWNVVNDDFQFAFKSLRKSNVDGKTRLHAVLNKIPHYSDDLGLTWEAAEGMTTYDNNWGFRDELLNSADGSSYLMKVQEWLPQPWHQSVGIYHSRDYSESFNKIHDFGNIQRTEVAVSNLINQNDFYVFCVYPDSGQQVVYKLARNSNELVWLNAADTLSYPDGQVPFFAAEFSGQVSLYTYDQELIFYRSRDFGEEWTAVGILPDEPWLWAGGIFVSPSDPDFMLLGAQDCYKSEDGGKTWMKINSWRDYYGNEEIKLHADMMYFNEVRNNDASTFHLISNDGGLSISYDNLKTTKNIALTNLNISEYYDCRTDLLDPQFIYAASQDQGFQRSVPSVENETLRFNQVDGGDFGHITFSKDGRNLWTVYPGGLVYYYSDPQHASRTLRWELESTNESVWLPPLAEHFDPDKILMAGGNVEGGEGSFLLVLSIQADSIFAEQLPFDFKKDSGGEITAIEVSPLNDNLWYVATSNGLFYFSKDAGLTWDVSAQVGPAPQYLYGTVILASSINEDVVYFGGSGYSTAPVYRSDDSGITFGQISKGLPPTLLIDLDANDDESMLFAACESGPYVYFQDDEQWYPLVGESAPLQAWWSVEYLKKGSLVRFATHGRGIWDFQIHEVLSSEKATHDFYVTNVKLEVELVAQNEEVVIECDQYFEGRGNHQLIASTGFYLSKDTVFDQDDIRLALTRELIKEKNFIATSTKATIPDSTEPGEYYVMVVIDVNDQYGEANESNNSSWAMISVIAEEAAHDFYMQNMHLEYDTVFIGEDLVVGIDQYFDGVGHHELLTFTGFYLSEDTIVDSTDIRLISTPRLIKEQVAANLTKSMTLPGSINEGSYFLIVYIDDGNLYPEVDEGNNQLWARLIVESMPTSVHNEVSQINFEAFPNPAVSHVYLNSHWEDFKEYLWYDIHGRILDRGSISGPKIEVPQTVAGYILLQLSEKKTDKIAVKKIFLDRK